MGHKIPYTSEDTFVLVAKLVLRAQPSLLCTGTHTSMPLISSWHACIRWYPRSSAQMTRRSTSTRQARLELLCRTFSASGYARLASASAPRSSSLTFACGGPLGRERANSYSSGPASPRCPTRASGSRSSRSKAAERSSRSPALTAARLDHQPVLPTQI